MKGLWPASLVDQNFLPVSARCARKAARCQRMLVSGRSCQAHARSQQGKDRNDARPTRPKYGWGDNVWWHSHTLDDASGVNGHSGPGGDKILAVALHDTG